MDAETGSRFIQAQSNGGCRDGPALRGCPRVFQRSVGSEGIRPFREPEQVSLYRVRGPGGAGNAPGEAAVPGSQGLGGKRRFHPGLIIMIQLTTTQDKKIYFNPYLIACIASPANPDPVGNSWVSASAGAWLVKETPEEILEMIVRYGVASPFDEVR